MKKLRFVMTFILASMVSFACSDDDSAVHSESFCGNGTVETGEACDDGNTLDGDGCSSKCEQESNPTPPICGNGIVESGEACDDGNTLDGDGCSSKCEQESNPIPPVCGNGIVESGEACDDGNLLDGDGCSSKCKQESNPISPVCGNGIVESGEACDDGNLLDGDGCSSKCEQESVSPNSHCGNGIVESDETCDDGNSVNGDGCSSKCIKETGYYPTPNPGPETKCNDKKHEAGEVCDPYFIGYELDGEERVCKVQNGQCVLSTSTVKSNCGTGTLEPDEECDDGNTADGDGCSRYCKKETTCLIENGSHAQAYLAVDGDTVRVKIINDGQCKPSKYIALRLHGIDSPECLKKPTPSPIDPSYNNANACDPAQADNFTDLEHSEPMGYAAQVAINDLLFSDENKGIVEIECETRSATDPVCLTDSTNYRFLAYLKVKKDGKYVDVAEELTRMGYAFSYTSFTSQRQAAYCAAELEAREAKVGVWSLGSTFNEAVSKMGDEKQSWLKHKSHAEICGE